MKPEPQRSPLAEPNFAPNFAPKPEPNRPQEPQPAQHAEDARTPRQPLHPPQPRRPVQYALDLLRPPAPTLDNFVVGENGVVLAALRDALAGLGPQFIHLWGPQGSGRSHLLAALRDKPRILVDDDVQGYDAAAQAALFGRQNGVRERPGHILLTSADAPPALLGHLREDVRTRLGWGLVFGLRPLADSDRETALRAHAGSLGVRLDDELIPYMLTRLPRDMRTLISVLDALDAYALARKRALTIPLLRDWLAADPDSAS